MAFEMKPNHLSEIYISNILYKDIMCLRPLKTQSLWHWEVWDYCKAPDFLSIKCCMILNINYIIHTLILPNTDDIDSGFVKKKYHLK